MADTVKVRIFKSYMDNDTQTIYEVPAEHADEGVIHEIPRAFYERLVKKRYRVELQDGQDTTANVERLAGG